jgi:hypothetical protein
MDIDKMTLREVFEASKNISIADGGLGFILKKIIDEIENIIVHENRSKGNKT